jgi:protein-disulfide isomerase
MFKFVNNKKRNSFPTGLFVSASLISLFVFGVFLTVFSANFTQQEFKEESKKRVDNLNKDDFVNKDFSEGDPFITKVPKLEDMLKGPISNGGDPDLGNSDSEITIVEFADYECEACRDQKKELEKIRKEYPDKIRFIWKDYPEANQDSSSFKAARAARCAGLRDKFWDYNDQLYKRSGGKLDRELFLSIAGEIGIKKEEFEQCLNDKRVDGLIMDNIKEANALGIKGIPFTYINDQEVMGKIGYEELKRIIEIEMKK